MTIKEATLMVMSNLCDSPTKQTTIVNKVVELTGLSYDSCRANAFRNVNAIPEIWTDYNKVSLGGSVC